ncbi:uncharacterized protein N7496_007564 [Penicillium cataractarum]|uniref:FAD dependent oxidoreductase domain-containing protein n=1 Tax=Penicillium cataractarum TaxID=2100454 RepID=A0A9W9V7C8_9EURO|nr:uncharacterized protein N7496_007564 [Penicillium cataractarum]KAJ5371472.1 hypothetical protein N7496_007564 [Penicillium cataractarum]
MKDHKYMLSRLITADPGLPRPYTREPYWLRIPHTLGEHQSPTLAPDTDVVVIGSGITGASVAHNLLEGDDTIRVTVLEARSLCSGASGRNGGHMVAYGGTDYDLLKTKLGVEEALQVIDFTFHTLDDLVTLIRQHGWEEDSKYRGVTRIRTFGDVETLEAARRSIAEFVAQRPDMQGFYKFIDPEEARKDHGLHGVTGALLFSAHALWPYKLVGKVFERLVKEYQSRFQLETNTPALSLQYEKKCCCTEPCYTINTPRGAIRATHVVYATNGYTGHLLPELRGPLYAHQGSMTVQNFGPEVPNNGGQYTWSHHHQPRHNPATTTTTFGTYYLQQNAESGYFFFGGERTTAEQSLSTDDTLPTPGTTQHLELKLASLLGKQPKSAQLISEWSGVMGYTADKLPLVGPVPEEVSHRSGKGEWIAAGFNGMGMCYAWRSGKAVSKTILGEKMSDWIPKAFMLLAERLNRNLLTEASVEELMRYFPPASSKRNQTALL